MKQSDIRAGDLLRAPDDDLYAHFIDRVTDDGFHLELVCSYTWERDGEMMTQYSKLAGHGCVVPHKSCSWWKGWDKHTKIGSIPSLMGQRVVTVSLPM